MGIILLKIGLFILAYLLGSIPSGLFVGKYFKGIILYEEGSKNVGTSNAIRVLGIKLGLLTLVLDVIKSVIVLLLVRHALPIWISGFDTFITINNTAFDFSVIYGIAAIIGHTFSIYLGFKGGKAVASSFAVALAITPIPALIAISIYFIIVAVIKYASIASTFATLSIAVTAVIQYIIVDKLMENLFVLIAYGLMIIFIIIKHIPNYKRLIKGTENKMYLTKKGKEKALR